MVSLGVGLQDQFVNRFTRSGMFDAVTVMAGGDQPGIIAAGRGAGRGGFGRRGFGRGFPPIENARDITDESLADLAKLPGVRAVYPQLRGPVEVKYGTLSESAQAA